METEKFEDESSFKHLNEHLDVLHKQIETMSKAVFAIQGQLAAKPATSSGRPPSGRVRTSGKVDSELQVTRSGRLRLVLSQANRTLLWRICKVLFLVAGGAAGSRLWIVLSQQLAH
jgi:hypothetical protein